MIERCILLCFVIYNGRKVLLILYNQFIC